MDTNKHELLLKDEVYQIVGFADVERGQVINYLRITGLRVGVILNFQRAKLEWERIVS